MDINCDNKSINEIYRKYEELGLWEHLNLGEHLREWAKKYKDNIAIVEGDNKLTYSEFDLKVDQLSLNFIDKGIKKGDNVVLQLPNTMSFVVNCFALFRVGAIPVLALPANREYELDGIFELVQPVAYIIPNNYLGFDYRNMADSLAKKNKCVKNIIVDDENLKNLSRYDINIADLNLEQPSYRDTAFLLLSGGTTGTPKLIPRTHSGYMYNAKMAAKRCRLNSESAYLTVLPSAHNFPFGNPGIVGTLSVGGKVVMCKTSSCDEIFPLIEKEKVTITALVPALMNLWLEVLEWDDSYDISSLKVVQVGGAMLDENVARRIVSEMPFKLQQVYGIAEGLICCTSLDDSDDMICSCQGHALSEYDDIKIVDENGEDVEKGNYGELLVRGPYTIKGYYKLPEQNSKSFTKDGYYCTGDKARITSERNIQIGGRIKEQINRAGEKIMPSEVESCLCKHPDIKEASVIGVPDKNLGQRTCAYLITEDRNLNKIEIHEFLKNIGLAKYKIPDQIEYIDFWPLTNVGKINKQKLREMVLENINEKGEKMKSYYEEKIKFNSDAYLIAAQITDLKSKEDYVLYENNGELSLGIGIYGLVKVNSEYTTLEIDGKNIELENGVLSETINKVFLEVKIKDWRSYGIINFGLARYNNNLPLLTEDECMVKMFIPKVEVRLLNNTILLRALKEEDLNDIKELVEDILENNLVENSLKARINKERINVPEIFTYDAEQYMDMVARGVKDIKDKKYQKIILSRKIPINSELDMVASYIAERRVNSPARSFLVNFEGMSVAGFSPETVVEVDDNGWASTFPLAGTRALVEDDKENERLKKELLSDPKEIAEHAVSVKLAFEELERFCDKETVRVTKFMYVENRGTVQHIASRLKGKIKEGYNSWHALNTLFPAVTASGIPKKESIEAIGKFEKYPRDLYSGGVITLDSTGAMDVALVLRTIYQKDNQAWIRAGAGIVEMSKPERELQETCEKLSSVSKQLISK
ncbi:salicylate synthase [Clostridium weizhouense]|uniref:Salicylate synthase n=1 Tax=Clostridium weizhouense TaxID=2859781 RepID=A0ABS7ALS8_9CLOT|nr:salicylate synthase [Clostridium weizhouense]MBW6409615.1 salicylate synthase [Clostridium weizhouense]